MWFKGRSMPSTQMRWGSKPARPLAVTETSTTFTVASQDHAPASNTRAKSKYDATITTTDNGRGSNMYIPTVGDARHHTPLGPIFKARGYPAPGMIPIPHGTRSESCRRGLIFPVTITLCCGCPHSSCCGVNRAEKLGPGGVLSCVSPEVVTRDEDLQPTLQQPATDDY